MFFAAGNEDQRFDSRFQCFLNGVLDQRFVHDRKHFLGNGLCCRQKPGAQACNGKYCLPDRFALAQSRFLSFSKALKEYCTSERDEGNDFG